jgi:hypothetical protein
MSITSTDIQKALAKKYCRPEWCIFFEVANQSGAYVRRYADAVAMSIWPSRGYAIHGFEIKVSRSDFNSEMKKPEKADGVGRYCDYWWLVTPPGMVEDHELPPTWGLMVLQKNGLRIKKQAPKQDVVNIDRGFSAALLRRSIDLQQNHIKAQIEKELPEITARAEQQAAQKNKRVRERAEENNKWIENFEIVLGQSFYTWEAPEDVANRLKLAKSLGDGHSSSGIKSLKSGCSQLLKNIEDFEGMAAAMRGDE